jgi:alkylated DNA nucleotide flippase Atl1
VRGPAWWVTEDGTDLAALAGDSTPVGRDWSDLHLILNALPAGHWTTYGDLAAVVGTAAQPLGQHVTRCPDCDAAYRILSSDGRPAANFRWGDPERTESVEDVLSAEGVHFTKGAADPSQRLTHGALRALIS